MLSAMHDDTVDFVRQGALISSALVLMQQPDVFPAIKPFREKIAGILKEKHPSTMTKMGAVLAHGLLDAGGRNVTLSLSSRAGFTKASAVVGVALWAQHWYWYPLQHMLGLSFSPTALIGLNKDFKMPTQFTAHCATKPSKFAYPKMTEAKKEEKKERVETVKLSTTAKAQARAAKKEKDEKKDDDVMDADEGEEKKIEGGEEKKEEEPEKKKKGPEPLSFKLSNPSRVTPEQVQYVSFDMNQRYTPINPRSKPAGIVILMDKTPDEPEDVTAVEVPTNDGNEDEADAPEPFEWSPAMQAAGASA
mmetsp:Transcript_12057/g.28050  ORF Transcript_12057/g.28050 Transcript_12057/m.28050 type:complete len:305 (+) Transcript_12057:194-1108(+)